MHDWLARLTAAPVLMLADLLAGALLGAFFFGGLWWTTRRATISARPALTVFTSLLLRMSLTLGGFYLVADGRWERLLPCLVGFTLARLCVTRLLCATAGSPYAP